MQVVAPPAAAVRPRPPRKPSWRSRGWWLKHVLRWHWVSSAMSLVCVLFFALTGVTLNHAGSIAGAPETVRRSAKLPAADLKLIQGAATDGGRRALPPQVAADAAAALRLDLPAAPAEWSEDAIDLDLSAPGAEGTLSIDRTTGALDYERTSHGWIAWANDLHKGRNAGSAWFWFIDLFAFGVIMFALTGLILLQLHASHRPKTWPLVGFGLALPILLILVFVHS